MSADDAARPGAFQKFRYAVELAVVWTLGLAFRLLPRGAALGLGDVVGQLGWWSRFRRRVVLRNLDLALPDLSTAARRRVAVRSMRNFGRTVAEFLRFAGRDRAQVGALVEVDGLDAVRAALEEGRGAIIVTGHLGAWALYTTAIAAAGLPATQIVGVQRNPLVDRLILRIPGDAVAFVSKGKGAPRGVLKALRDNRVVVLVADHYSSDQQILVPFLGTPAFTNPLPSALIARHRFPLFSMAGHRIDGGRHQVTLRPVEIPDAEGDALRVAAAVRVNEALGEGIRAHPEQYFWFHDRWKARPRPLPRWVDGPIAVEPR